MLKTDPRTILHNESDVLRKDRSTPSMFFPIDPHHKYLVSPKSTKENSKEIQSYLSFGGQIVCWLIHLILLFQYRSDFPSSIKEHAVFADIAPRFHLMAEEILQKQIQLIIFNLKEVQSCLERIHHVNLTSTYENLDFYLPSRTFKVLFYYLIKTLFYFRLQMVLMDSRIPI